MQMNLKNIKTKKIITKKNLLLFIVVLLVSGFITGIIFYLSMKNADQLTANSNIVSYFNNDIVNKDIWFNLKHALFNNLFYVILSFLLGISLLGVIVILFLLFMKGFTTGFTITTILSKYSFKGILGIILYLLPDKLLTLFLFIFMSYFSVMFSYNLFCFLFLKKELELHSLLKSYANKLIIGLILGIVVSILEVFVTPFVLKLFTFIVK